MSRPKRQQRKDAEERRKQEVERLRRELAERERQIAEQVKRIADLERQLALRQQNSTTTSKPPSSDGLAGRQRERSRRTKSRRLRAAPAVFAGGRIIWSVAVHEALAQRIIVRHHIGEIGEH